MNIQLLIIFVLLNIFNVTLQTVKSIITIKCGKAAAAIINAIAYGLYTVVLVYTVCDLPLMLKAFIVAVCNLIGVYIVKDLEERLRKDKLWKIEMTIPVELKQDFKDALSAINISNYYNEVGKYVVFTAFAPTQAESTKIKNIADKYNAKYFVSETKTLY